VTGCGIMLICFMVLRCDGT